MVLFLFTPLLTKASPQTPLQRRGTYSVRFSHSEERIDVRSKVGVSKAGVTCGPRYPLIRLQALGSGLVSAAIANALV